MNETGRGVLQDCLRASLLLESAINHGWAEKETGSRNSIAMSSTRRAKEETRTTLRQPVGMEKPQSRETLPHGPAWVPCVYTAKGWAKIMVRRSDGPGKPPSKSSLTLGGQVDQTRSLLRIERGTL
jgi:hypothetical protein